MSNLITCLTTTCEGRGLFLARCKTYVERFHLIPHEHLIVSQGHIEQNTAIGLDRVKTKYVAFIEDDDWYSPNHLSHLLHMATSTNSTCVGYNPTIYYHIIEEGYRLFSHPGRASMYTTLCTTEEAKCRFDHAVKNHTCCCGRIHYLDIAMWEPPENKLCSASFNAVGIKHGLTETEGNGHKQPSDYWTKDRDMRYLESLIGDEDAQFYKNLRCVHPPRIYSNDKLSVDIPCDKK